MTDARGDPRVGARLAGIPAGPVLIREIPRAVASMPSRASSRSSAVADSRAAAAMRCGRSPAAISGRK